MIDILIYHKGVINNTKNQHIEPILKHNAKILNNYKIHFLGCCKNENTIKKYESLFSNFTFENCDYYDLNCEVSAISISNYDKKKSGDVQISFYRRYLCIAKYVEKNNIQIFFHFDSDVLILNSEILNPFLNIKYDINTFESGLFIPFIFTCNKKAILCIADKIKTLLNSNNLSNIIKNYCFSIDKNNGCTARSGWVGDMWVIKGILNESSLKINYIKKKYKDNELFLDLLKHIGKKISFKNNNWYHDNKDIIYYLHIHGYTKKFIYILEKLINNKKSFILNSIPNPSDITFDKDFNNKNYITIL